MDKSNIKVLLTLHQREILKHDYEKLIGILLKIHSHFPEFEILWIRHPKTIIKIKEDLLDYPPIKFVDHLSNDNFVNFYNSTALLITDSVGVSEEASEIGIPVVIFRNMAEREEPFPANYPIIVSNSSDQIVTFVRQHILNKVAPSNFYGNVRASEKLFNWLKQELHPPHYNTIIVGGGPAGTGILMKAIKDGYLSDILSHGLAIFEKNETLVNGTLDTYAVNSDTYSNVFLECLEGEATATLSVEALAHELEVFKKYTDRSIPLKATSVFLKKIGAQLQKILESHERSDVYFNSIVLKVICLSDGSFEIITSENKKFTTNKLVMACGGIPKPSVLASHLQHKSFHSDKLLKGKCQEFIEKLDSDAKVVIIGGSHSAFSAAHFLIENYSEKFSVEKPIIIWANQEPKIFFPNKEEAKSHGYNEFKETDICKVTGKVFRLAGLRMDGRELYMKMLGMNSTDFEKRVSFRLIHVRESIYRDALENCSLIIEATGYTFNMPSFYDHHNNLIQLAGETSGHWVDNESRVLLKNHDILKNVFAMGMASGYIPEGALGGEASFTGQTNGLWYYQNLLAEVILKQLDFTKTTFTR